MRVFILNRHRDISGVSGTGIVAEGVVFANGKIVIAWLGEVACVGVYDSIDAVEKIHGHEGATTIEFTT